MSERENVGEAPVPAIGQVWRGCADYTLTKDLGQWSEGKPGQHAFECTWDDGSGLAVGMLCGSLYDGSCTFLRSPDTKEREAGEAPRWERWLPPGPTPLHAPMEFRVGQVVALNIPNNLTGVFLIGEHPPHRVLAGDHDGGRFGSGGPCSRYAVLVAEPGCAPTDPAILYGHATPTPAPVPAPVLDTPETRQAALIAKTDALTRKLRLKYGAVLCRGCGEVFDRVGKSGRCGACYFRPKDYEQARAAGTRYGAVTEARLNPRKPAPFVPQCDDPIARDT